MAQGFRYALAGGQIGGQVGIAEAVNRLFGIAHQKARQGAVAIHRLQDLPLQGVGVLEFVDQCSRKSRTQALGQCHTDRGLQGSVQVVQHVIESLHAQRTLGIAQCRAAMREHVPQQPPAQGIPQIGQRRARVQKPLHDIKQGMIGGRQATLDGGCRQDQAVAPIQRQLALFVGD